MSLAADIITIGVCSLTSGVIGYTIRDIQADRQARRKPPPPPPLQPGMPEAVHRAETGTLEAYGVTQVKSQCANPRCRQEHPDPDVVLVGVGLSGSSYHCRHCGETW